MAGSGNSNLHRAKDAKQDEFYTQLSDIENELQHYKEHFKNKVVFCNCDDPYESNFFKYFILNFNYLGLKKLITTCYSTSSVSGTQISLFDEPSPNNSAHPYKVVIDHVEDLTGNGAIDLDDIQLLLKKPGIVQTLEGDGDFRSAECIELLKEADIVVTNPPFSLFREFIALLMECKKDFLIIGSQNAITYKEIFPLIMTNKLWLGYKSGDMSFTVPDYYEARETRYWQDENGQKWRSLGNACWFTNLDHNKRHEPLELYKRYKKHEDEYPHYDNYDAIEVSKTSEIPYDYDGMMGVPITFVSKYSPDQFVIVGMAKRGAGDPALKSKTYTKDDYPNYSDLNAGPVLIDENGNLYNTYPRILIRRKD